jgi:hypothetical protein
MMTKKHRNFPSDMALLFTAAGATISAADLSGTVKTYSVLELLNAPAAQTALVTKVSRLRV